MAEVDLFLNAEHFIKQAEAAARKVRELSEGFDRFNKIARSLQVDPETGARYQQIVFEVERLNKAGTRIIDTWKAVTDTLGNYLTLTQSRAAKATESIYAQAEALKTVSQALRETGKVQNLLDQRGSIARGQVRGVTPDEEARLRIAQSGLLEFVAAGKTTTQEIEKVFGKIQNGTLLAGEASKQLLTLIRAVIQAEENLGKAAEAASEKAARGAKKAEAAKQRERNLLFSMVMDAQAAAAAQERLQKAFADSLVLRQALDRRVRSVPDATDDEVLRLRAAQTALVEFVRQGKASTEQIEALFDKIANGTLEAGDASKKLIGAVRELIKAEENLGKTAEASRAKAKKRSDQAAANLEREKKLLQEMALDAQKAAATQAQAQQALVEAQNIAKFLSRRVSGQRAPTAAVSDAEQSRLLAAQNAIVRLVAAGKAGSQEVANLFKKITDGTYRAGEASQQLLRAIQAVIKAEQQLGKAAETASKREAESDKKRREAKQREIDLLEQEIKLEQQAAAAEAARKQSNLRQAGQVQGFLASRAGAARGASGFEVSRDEEFALRQSQRNVLRLLESGQFTAKQVRDAFRDIESGSFKVTAANEKLLQSILELIRAEERLGQASRRESERRTKQLVKEAQARQRVAKAFQEQAVRDINAAQVKTVTRQGVPDLRTREEGGKANVDDVRSFLQAERSLERLASKGKATFAEIASAIKRAREGTLTLASATTDAEKAALRLASAQRRIGQETRISTGLVKTLTDSLINAAKITGFGLLLGNLFRLQSTMEEAIRTANEFSVQIGRIQTIEDEVKLGTDRWSESLRQLSDRFGIPILTQAEAAYQTLSNQVAEGERAIRFLNAANQLAIAGVTDTASAVETLTSVLNAYKLPVEEAELVSARLFRIVDLGRVSVEELRNTFGRITVPAALLGIGLDELGAAMAVTTIQGFRFEAASTLLRNIMLKLIRPTEELKNFFADIGVNSGEAAIKTFGFAGVLQLLEERTRGSSTEIGELFNELRATTGGMALLGENTAQYEETLRKIRETDVNKFLQATNTVLETSGQQLKIAAEQAKNFFEVSLGKPLINATAAFIREMGGIRNVLEAVLEGIEFGAKVVLPLLASRMIFVGGTAAKTYIQGLIQATWTTNQFNGSATLLAKTALPAFTAVSAALIALSQQHLQHQRDALKAVEAEQLTALETSEKISDLIETIQRKETEDLRRESTRRSRILFQELANRRKVTTQQQILAVKEAEALDRRFKRIQQSLTSFVTEAVNVQEKRISDARKAIESSVAAIRDLLDQATKRPLDFDLSIAGLGQQRQILDQEIATLQAEATAATVAGDFEAFNRIRKQLQALQDQKVEAEVSYQRENFKLIEEERKARKAVFDARTSEELAAAKERLKQLERERQLLESGTKSQIDLEKRRQELESKARTGTPEESIQAKKALEELKKEQEDLNRLAQQERDIRLQGLEAARKTAEQLLEINKINVERERAAQKEAAELRAAQFSLQLLTKDAEAFKTEEVLASDNAADISKAVKEQQERFARIIQLQERLGAGEEARQIIEQKAANLQEQTSLRLQQLRADEHAKTLDNLDEQFKKEIEHIKELTKADRIRLEEIADRIQQIRNDAFIANAANARTPEALRQAGRNFGLTRLDPRDFDPLESPDAFTRSQTLGQQLQVFANLLAQTQQLLQTQARTPSSENAQAIKALSERVRQVFSPVVADLEANLSKLDPIRQARDRQRILELITLFQFLTNRDPRSRGVSNSLENINRVLERVADAERRHSEIIESVTGESSAPPTGFGGVIPPNEIQGIENFLQRFRQEVERIRAEPKPTAPGLEQFLQASGIDTRPGLGRDLAKESVAAGKTFAEVFGEEASKSPAQEVGAAIARSFQEAQKSNAPDVAKEVATAQADAVKRAGILDPNFLDLPAGVVVDASGNILSRRGGRQSRRTNVDVSGNLVTKPFAESSRRRAAAAAAADARQAAINARLEAFLAETPSFGPGQAAAEAALAEIQRKQRQKSGSTGDPEADLKAQRIGGEDAAQAMLAEEYRKRAENQKKLAEQDVQEISLREQNMRIMRAEIARRELEILRLTEGLSQEAYMSVREGMLKTRIRSVETFRTPQFNGERPGQINIEIVVNEAADAKVTAREVVQQINRGIRQGLYRLGAVK